MSHVWVLVVMSNLWSTWLEYPTAAECDSAMAAYWLLNVRVERCRVVGPHEYESEWLAKDRVYPAMTPFTDPNGVNLGRPIWR